MGKEVWQEKYATGAATGPAGRFPGPRCSPAVADGKVVTLGVQGILSCLDAGSGKLLWRKDDFKGKPMFFTSSSPIFFDGTVIAQLGGQNGGGIAAYTLADGKEKWKWTGDGPAYASPVLMTVGDTKVLIAETSAKIVGLNAADGKQLWETSYPVTGGRGYNASTPMAEGQTVVYSGSNRGVKAVKFEKQDGGLSGKELWNNPDNSVIYNTPIVKNGHVFGQSSKEVLFCINAESGKTEWTSTIKGAGGYGSIVDAGSVLFSLTPVGQLVVFEPSDKAFKEIASYKVGSDTYAYPIVTGKGIYVKDKDSVAFWAID
jgi:outer membrane protein assembly factor BamB